MINYVDENFWVWKKKVFDYIRNRPYKFFDRIDLSEGIHVAKISNIEGCLVCHNWYFDNSCHNLTMLCLSDTAVIIVKDVDFYYIINDNININQISSNTFV